jgi:hypothetical protein
MILAVADEDGMKRPAPYYWEQGGRIHPSSVFVEAPDRYYIAPRSDLRAGNPEGISARLTRRLITLSGLSR